MRGSGAAGGDDSNVIAMLLAAVVAGVGWLPNWLPSDERFDREYLVHRSVLRSHGAFRCAGDTEAEAFCNEVADAMVTARGVMREEAVARVNRQWSSTWIVGLDLVYHETAEQWAEHIYRHT